MLNYPFTSCFWDVGGGGGGGGGLWGLLHERIKSFSIFFHLFFGVYFYLL